MVFLKGGRGKSGAKAIASHTGALAGDLAAYRAGFRRAGVLWANTMEELFDWGRALAWQPLPEGNRVAILTNAGGPAILAADALEDDGMSLAPLTADTKAFLRSRVLPAASVENPVDILAGAGPATYALCLDALLADETVDAVVVIQAPQDWFRPASLAEVVGEVASMSRAQTTSRPEGTRARRGTHKPVLTVIMGLATAGEATQILHSRHIPNYQFPERVGSTLGAMWQRKQWLTRMRRLGRPATSGECEIWAAQSLPHRPVPQSLFHAPGSEGWLPPDRIEALLSAYHIPTPGEWPRAGLPGGTRAG